LGDASYGSCFHAAPLRLRVERQLGYDQAKYIMRIELVDSVAGLWGGNGGYREDRGDEWYAGIWQAIRAVADRTTNGAFEMSGRKGEEIEI
jgi:DMSO/TMAO reductase YedYZ molybdopterin-dependent catalytic subunit